MAYANLPIGSIILWKNTTIPSGWSVCNGSGGTPDLRDKFVRGASVDGDIRDTGGATTHTHTNSNTSTRSAHNHGGTKNFSVGNGAGQDTTDGTGVVAASANHTHDVGIDITGADSHAHTVGDTGSASNLPPYIYRVYIRRMT